MTVSVLCTLNIIITGHLNPSHHGARAPLPATRSLGDENPGVLPPPTSHPPEGISSRGGAQRVLMVHADCLVDLPWLRVDGLGFGVWGLGFGV